VVVRVRTLFGMKSSSRFSLFSTSSEGTINEIKQQIVSPKKIKTTNTTNPNGNDNDKNRSKRSTNINSSRRDGSGIEQA